MANRRKPFLIGFWHFIILLFATLKGYGQVRSLKLFISDAQQQPVANAGIKVDSAITVTDMSGNANVAVAPGKHQVVITAVGYEPAEKIMTIQGDTSVPLELKPAQTQLKTITVYGERQVTLGQMSTHIIGIDQLKRMPVLFGEVDPLKTITLLPGIKNGGDAGAGIYVRGGGPDQNLVLLDGITVYNPNHLLGAFSIFNGDAVSNIEVIKGGMPAEYGGRLSSVIAVTSRDGNKDSLKVSGGIGLISSRLTAEGPLVKGKSSFLISARRTYIDQLAKLIAPDSFHNSGYHFYDINAKLTYDINAANSLSFTVYNGKDKFAYYREAESSGRKRNFKADWGNAIAGLTWKQQISKKLHQELSLVYSYFNLGSNVTYDTDGIIFSSGLNDYQVKNDWLYHVNDKLFVKAGWQLIRHEFKPGAGETNAGQQEFASKITKQYGREAAGYLSAGLDVTRQFHITGGLRVSYFDQVGPTERVLYGEDGVPTGQKEKYNKGVVIARYYYPEPRLGMRYLLAKDASLKLSYTRTVQYLQLATTSAATFPSDLWVPVSKLIKPGIADQVAAGFYQEFPDKGYEFSVETYYKRLQNQVEFKPGAQLLLNQNLEGEMVFGTGRAYGIELLLQKKTGALTGWIGYTLSKTERTFPALNNGMPYPYRYDRTHDLSVTANYQLSKKWLFSGVFVYGTGNALTMPGGRFVYNLGYNTKTDEPVFTNIDQYGKVNDYRMPAYHRLDLSFSFTPNPDSKKRFKSNWIFGVYNVYNRMNPYFIYLDVNEEKETIQGKQVTLFPILPSVTWNFNF
ncbi:TonB-dependent receptor plug domain-containing protein [Chitinophaga sp. sic0106]|uniref:TonB-dependent receptor n=1 Tax=Chitinophaga sp. sic0106 TaxID=2854785 RepID=UPI001C4800FE|nr:TonB-dependent receptor plug domain-containing protein [Chitinophaga sp. sic0106]MBV7530678.1 TonB-dependent receptor [Chitinophaga sp. sic0106]